MMHLFALLLPWDTKSSESKDMIILLIITFQKMYVMTKLYKLC